MVRQCQVCKKSDYLNPDVSFHRLTKKRYHPWLEALGLDPEEKYSSFTVLCSTHFDKSDIEITPRGNRSLKVGAIPKINLGPNVEYRRSQRKTVPKLFPVNPDKRQIWFSLVGFEEGKKLPKNPEICSDHFDPSDIHIKANGLRYIDPDATPRLQSSVFSEPSSISSDSSDFTVYDTPPKIVVGLPLEAIDQMPISHHTPYSDIAGTSKSIFPDNVDRRKAWLNALQMDNAKKWHYICSGHFQKNDYYLTKTNIRMLRKDAVPSVQTQIQPISKTTSRNVIIGTLKNVPAVGRIPYEEFYSENESSSNSSSTDTASETKYYGINIEASVLAGQNPSRGVMESIHISSQISDSSTDSADEAGDYPLVTPSDLAEPNSLKSVIKQEAFELIGGSIINAPILGGAQINEQFPSASNSQMQLDSLNREVKHEVKQEDQSDQSITIISITDEQLIEMLESESPLLTPELLLSRGNNCKTKKRYFGDISLNEFQTQEERDYYTNAQKRIREGKTKIHMLQKRTRRIKKRLEEISEVVSMVENVCDVEHIKRILAADVDIEESSDDNASNIGEDTNISTGNLDENEIDSFNFANQVQVTFLSGSDTPSEDKLKKELQKVARKDIIKSKRVNKLNNAIFEKDIIIEELKSTLNKLKNVV